MLSSHSTLLSRFTLALFFRGLLTLFLCFDRSSGLKAGQPSEGGAPADAAIDQSQATQQPDARLIPAVVARRSTRHPTSVDRAPLARHTQANNAETPRFFQQHSRTSIETDNSLHTIATSVYTSASSSYSGGGTNPQAGGQSGAAGAGGPPPMVNHAGSTSQQVGGLNLGLTRSRQGQPQSQNPNPLTQSSGSAFTLSSSTASVGGVVPWRLLTPRPRSQPPQIIAQNSQPSDTASAGGNSAAHRRHHTVRFDLPDSVLRGGEYNDDVDGSSTMRHDFADRQNISPATLDEEIPSPTPLHSLLQQGGGDRTPHSRAGQEDEDGEDDHNEQLASSQDGLLPANLRSEGSVRTSASSSAAFLPVRSVNTGATSSSAATSNCPLPARRSRRAAFRDRLLSMASTATGGTVASSSSTSGARPRIQSASTVSTGTSAALHHISNVVSSEDEEESQTLSGQLEEDNEGSSSSDEREETTTREETERTRTGTGSYSIQEVDGFSPSALSCDSTAAMIYAAIEGTARGAGGAAASSPASRETAEAAELQQSSSTVKSEPTPCAICLSAEDDASKIVILGCGHATLHWQCLRRWVRVGTNANRCPVCRATLAPSFINDLLAMRDDQVDAEDADAAQNTNGVNYENPQLPTLALGRRPLRRVEPGTRVSRTGVGGTTTSGEDGSSRDNPETTDTPRPPNAPPLHREWGRLDDAENPPGQQRMNNAYDRFRYLEPRRQQTWREAMESRVQEWRRDIQQIREEVPQNSEECFTCLSSTPQFLLDRTIDCCQYIMCVEPRICVNKECASLCVLGCCMCCNMAQNDAQMNREQCVQHFFGDEFEVGHDMLYSLAKWNRGSEQFLWKEVQEHDIEKNSSHHYNGIKFMRPVTVEEAYNTLEEHVKNHRLDDEKFFKEIFHQELNSGMYRTRRHFLPPEMVNTLEKKFLVSREAKTAAEQGKIAGRTGTSAGSVNSDTVFGFAEYEHQQAEQAQAPAQQMMLGGGSSGSSSSSSSSSSSGVLPQHPNCSSFSTSSSSRSSSSSSGYQNRSGIDFATALGAIPECDDTFSSQGAGGSSRGAQPGEVVRNRLVDALSLFPASGEELPKTAGRTTDAAGNEHQSASSSSSGSTQGGQTPPTSAAASTSILPSKTTTASSSGSSTSSSSSTAGAPPEKHLTIAQKAAQVQSIYIGCMRAFESPMDVGLRRYPGQKPRRDDDDEEDSQPYSMGRSLPSGPTTTPPMSTMPFMSSSSSSSSSTSAPSGGGASTSTLRGRRKSSSSTAAAAAASSSSGSKGESTTRKITSGAAAASTGGAGEIQNSLATAKLGGSSKEIKEYVLEE
ncbi:unnamed protein product [Amoebophrya sp. A120]|nr:unnamed protein product [Amoebophrya sp. A120]|eukprot:GSA120T00015819001.1